MLNILAVSYTNIGPFTDTRSVVFHAGKFLIKAPIGSGKSFLFFDGPVAALYKYAARPLLNRKSSEGKLSCLFTINDEHYIVERKLTHGKSKDKMQSRLFRCEIRNESWLEQDASEKSVVVLHDCIQTARDNKSITTDEIVFKSDTDLQKTIEDLIPPREVMTTTQFLLQDSSNFFAMTPVERISVFKNIFNLLSIDTAKEIIADRRRTMQAHIRVLQDSNEADVQLQDQMKTLLQQYRQLQERQLYPMPWLDDLLMMQEVTASKRGSEGFDLSLLDRDDLLQKEKNLTLDIEQSQKEEVILHELQSRYQQHTKELQEIVFQKAQLTKDIQAIIAKTPNMSEEELSSKTLESIQGLQNKQKIMLEYFDRVQIQKYMQNNTLDISLEGNTIRALQGLVNELRSEGKNLRNQENSLQQRKEDYQKTIMSLEKQLQNSELREGNEAYQQLQQAIHKEENGLKEQRDAVTQQRQLLDQQKKTIDQQIKDITQRINEMQKDLNAAKRFPCSKINADCPFIEQIAAGSLRKFTKQIELLESEKKALHESFDQTKRSTDQKVLTEKSKQINQLLSQLKTEPKLVITDFFEHHQSQQQKIRDRIQDLKKSTTAQELESQQKKIQQHIQQVAEVLKLIQRKKVEEFSKQGQENELQIKQLQFTMTQLHQKQQAQQEQKRLLTTKQIQEEETIKKEKNLTLTIREMQKKIAEGKERAQSYSLNQKKSDHQAMQIMKQKIERITEIIQQSTNKQQKLKQLKRDEEKIKNLYHIFSKELMYVVLEDTLPVLFDIINSYLAQVADYSIHFALKKTASDKVELDVTINDQKGERSVQSLSGGQKVLLKIVRILAIVSYTRANALFLDETINNLDENTVSKVAQMLEDFVRQREVKLYIVTHSQQIQQMNIWDGVIQL